MVVIGMKLFVMFLFKLLVKLFDTCYNFHLICGLGGKKGDVKSGMRDRMRILLCLIVGSLGKSSFIMRE